MHVHLACIGGMDFGPEYAPDLTDHQFQRSYYRETDRNARTI